MWNALNTSHCGKDAQQGNDMQWGVGLGWARCRRFWPAFGLALPAEVDQRLWSPVLAEWRTAAGEEGRNGAGTEGACTRVLRHS